MTPPVLAERRALQVVAEFGVAQAPVPVAELAVALGAELIYEPFDGDVSGLLIRNEDESVVIGVNAQHHQNRQRFTIAHEIGHLLLHRGDPLFIDKQVRIEFRDERASLANDPKEIAANRFAAELLMPRDVLHYEADQFLSSRADPDSEIVVSALAKKFAVSQQAMQFRLTNLGYWAPL